MKKDKTTTAELREHFDTLSLDDKATFLVQATFSTAAATIDEIGTRISELVDALGAEPEPHTEPHESEEEEPTIATQTAHKATHASTAPHTPPEPEAESDSDDEA